MYLLLLLLIFVVILLIVIYIRRNDSKIAINSCFGSFLKGEIIVMDKKEFRILNADYETNTLTIRPL